MKLLSLLVLGLAATLATSDSLITAENGVYSGITVRVEEDVPRHSCHKILNRLEVGEMSKNTTPSA